MSPEEVLFVLNELKPVTLDSWTFCVITGREEGAKPSYWPFERGEILVLEPNGREPFGEGRKPAKWFVTTEEFDTLAEALACRAQMLERDEL
jgi:hypothetical protein